MTKLTKFFRTSRGLRHRPSVERNVYSPSHSGLRASEVRPEPALNRLRHALGSVGRSITSMRLPAIPPSEVNNVTQMARVNSLGSRPPAPLPHEASSRSQETELTRTESRVHDVPLPIRVVNNPESEDSDSDDDKEYIPKHRFSMVRRAKEQSTNIDLDKVEESNQAETNEEDTEKMEYIVVDVIKEPPITGANADPEDKTSATQTDANNDRTDGAAKNMNQDVEVPIEYTNIDKEKTLSLARELSTMPENENQESSENLYQNQ